MCTGYKTSGLSCMLLLHLSMYSICYHLYFTAVVVYSPLHFHYPPLLPHLPTSWIHSSTTYIPSDASSIKIHTLPILSSFPTNYFLPVVDPPAALGLGSMFAHDSEDQEQKLADPYATVSAFGHRCRTETIQNSRYPIWNERLNFPLKVYPIYSSLHNIMFHLVTYTCMSFL